jgi:hypothetical protein
MNPNVSNAASKVGFDAASYTWFDFYDVPENIEKELEEVVREKHLIDKTFALNEFYTPSENMAVLHPGIDNTVFTYDRSITIGKYTGAAVMMWALNGDENPLAVVTQKPVNVVENDYFGDTQSKHVFLNKHFLQSFLNKGETQEQAMKKVTNICISAINYACLINMRAHKTDEVLLAHNAKGMDFINRKRKAKHQPLLYSWNTIELKPSAQVVQENKGGSHASPARHKRRAHFRKKRDGSFAWIPEMWVGSIENGLIVHDYVADKKLTKEENL